MYLSRKVRHYSNVLVLGLFVSTLMILWWAFSYFNAKQCQFGEKFDRYARPETAPILFIGGRPASGTTLTRVMLDAHPMIRCGGEAMTILPVFEMWDKLSAFDQKNARETKVYPKVFNQAVAQYTLTTVREMGPPADILCYKRPYLIRHVDQLAKLFPLAKFLHVLRDGRASAASHMIRNLFAKTESKTLLRLWSDLVNETIVKCQQLPEGRCLTIRYEHLVLYPEREMRAITEFIGIPWDPVVLRHHTALENISQIVEFLPGTPRVKQKIDTNAMDYWYRDDPTPDKYLRTVDKDFPLLRALGYLDIGQPPDYTRLSRNVWLNVSAFHN